MEIIFCGTPQFAVPTLEKLAAEGFEIALVVTNPDEPVGRGYKVQAPPVKQAAVRLKLDLFQPANLKPDSVRERISAARPDAIVVAAYGHMIPKWMIALPRLGCINLHASLLPKYRGASPIQAALMNGEPRTGITTMQIDAGLDTGGMLLTRRVEIADNDTTESLSEKLSGPGAELMVETLRKLEKGEIEPQPQDDAQSSYAPLIKKSDGVIDFQLPADRIFRRVRGLRPWPGAFTTFRGKRLHVWWAVASPDAPEGGGQTPGSLAVKGKKVLAACGEGSWLELKEVQLEGRKRISARDFANGVRLQPGERLG